MKKIIAISVMLALVAGAVFADTTVSGLVETRFSLAKQQGADGDDPLMGGSIGAAQIKLSGSNADGTLGGAWRFKQTAWGHSNGGMTATDPMFDQVFVWWKPIEQVKIFLGIDQDGLFDTCDFVGWGYHSGDNDYLFNHQWDFWRQIFPGNWDGFGLAASFYPIPGLDLNLVFPSGGVNWPQATKDKVEKKEYITDSSSTAADGMIPGRLRFTGNYSLDFGKISFAYLGGGVVAEKGKAAGFEIIDKDNNGLVGVSVLVTAIDGVLIKVGGSAILNSDSDMVINGGFGAAYTGDGFGVKARAGLVMQGDADLFITGSVMPYFNVGEKGLVNIDIGVTTQGDSMGWFVTPAYRLKIDGGQFAIGIQLFNNVKNGGNIGISGADFVRWNIPLSLGFAF